MERSRLELELFLTHLLESPNNEDTIETLRIKCPALAGCLPIDGHGGLRETFLEWASRNRAGSPGEYSKLPTSRAYFINEC